MYGLEYELNLVSLVVLSFKRKVSESSDAVGFISQQKVELQ